MAEEGHEKIIFIMDHGLYCYKVIPFGLKNVGATYQRLVNKVFANQLGKNMEAYVDDMLIKSKSIPQHIVDLEETFSTLRKHGMRPNLAKFMFKVMSRKFFSFIVSQRGIETNPKNIRVELDLPPPCTVKEIQSLVGRIASLSRFIFRLVEQSLPFFNALC